ncbi:response regulator transcription factor [Fulvivirgaceae bacterium BMA10]|uniref:Response regulator transcription factor n=1 Tax=Splendidivirga corallicola TaxID=3051826 RepID=A0ABT8KU75_9BACT|nr:response regulator transcription factor [Fulvivirgaceae bacterium BMA10]
MKLEPLVSLRQLVLSFSLLIVASLIFYRLSRFSFISGGDLADFLIGFFALLFFIMGVYLTRKFLYQKSRPSRSRVIDKQQIEKLGLSRRESEILPLIALGLSNQEIADKLFVTESTVKKHVSSLLLKLNAKRRTEAIRIAKDLRIVE